MRRNLIAVVPARSGSKRLAGKNAQVVGGRTLVEHAVTAGVETSGIERVFIDTDSSVLRRLAVGCGAESPYLRPRELARDDTPTSESLIYLLDYLRDVEGYDPEAVVLLQPTSPLRNSTDVSNGIAAWKMAPERPHASVCRPIQEPRDILRRLPSGALEYALSDTESVDLMFEDGAVYITPVEYLRRTRQVFRPSDGNVFEIPSLHGVDVDEAFQLEVARALWLRR